MIYKVEQSLPKSEAEQRSKAIDLDKYYEAVLVRILAGHLFDLGALTVSREEVGRNIIFESQTLVVKSEHIKQLLESVQTLQRCIDDPILKRHVDVISSILVSAE